MCRRVFYSVWVVILTVVARSRLFISNRLAWLSKGEDEDPDFAASDRDVLYYARALQEPTPAINGDTIRAKFDLEGNAVSVEPCYGDYRVDASDDCLAPAQERAWSSPIFVNQPRAEAS